MRNSPPLLSFAHSRMFSDISASSFSFEHYKPFVHRVQIVFNLYPGLTTAIENVQNVPRSIVEEQARKIPVFAIHYDQRLTAIVRKQWMTMTMVPYPRLEDVIPDPLWCPLTLISSMYFQNYLA